MPTSVTLGPSSDTVYLFSYSHTPVSENFPRMCSKKGITCSAMVNNLRDLWLKSQFYNKGGSTLYQGNTRSDMLPTHEKTINLKSIKMGALNSSSSWQTIKVALIEALKSTPLLEPVGRFFENNEIELAKEYCADTTKVSTYANHTAISYVLNKLTTPFSRQFCLVN